MDRDTDRWKAKKMDRGIDRRRWISLVQKQAQNQTQKQLAIPQPCPNLAEYPALSQVQNISIQVKYPVTIPFQVKPRSRHFLSIPVLVPVPPEKAIPVDPCLKENAFIVFNYYTAHNTTGIIDPFKLFIIASSTSASNFRPPVCKHSTGLCGTRTSQNLDL